MVSPADGWQRNEDVVYAVVETGTQHAAGYWRAEPYRHDVLIQT